MPSASGTGSAPVRSSRREADGDARHRDTHRGGPHGRPAEHGGLQPHSWTNTSVGRESWPHTRHHVEGRGSDGAAGKSFRPAHAAPFLGSSRETMVPCRGTHVQGATIRADIIRGVQLKRTLARRGWAWRTQVQHCADEVKVEMYNLSEPVEALDYFISHTWASPGWQKYLSLLFLTGRLVALMGFVVSVVVLAGAELLGWLPHMLLYNPGFDGWDKHVQDNGIPVGLWCTAFCPGVALLFLFLSPMLPTIGRDQLVFLDQACIHQSDQNLKMEGIYSLGGFLNNSKTLLILWTPPYFSRLWCVFELAAFEEFCVEGGEIKFLPVFMPIALLGIYLLFWTDIVVVLVAMLLVDTNLALAVIGPLFLAQLVAIPILRRGMRKKGQLKRQLANFDCREASCFLEADRSYIEDRIQLWHGSIEEFNRNVRERLRLNFLKIAQVHRLTYGSALTFTVPVLATCVDFFVAFLRAGAPRHILVNFTIFSVGMSFTLMPVGSYILFYLSERFADRRSSKLQDLGLNIFLAVIANSFFFLATAGWIIAARTLRGTLLFGSVWVGLLIWVFLRRSVSLRTPAEEEPQPAAAGRLAPPSAAVAAPAADGGCSTQLAALPPAATPAPVQAIGPADA